MDNQQEAVNQIAEATGAKVNIQEMEALLESKFTFLYNQLKKESSGLSAKQLQRALFNAMDIGVDSGLAPRMISKEEAIFAGYLGQLLDLRNVKLARTYLANEEKQNKEAQDGTTTEQA